MVSDRTGLDAVTIAVLECLDEMGARVDGQHKKSASVADRAYETGGIPPRYAYDAICTGAAPWLVHMLVVDFHGNWGGPDSLDEPAASRYTEVRLSRAGAMALAAERGELPRLPLGLINGDLAFGGTSPAFDPARVIAAVRAAGARAVGDEEVVELIGLPVFPTECSVEGDLEELARGVRTKLRMSAVIVSETDDRGSRLVLSRVPFGVGPADVADAIVARVDAARSGRLSATHPEIHNELDLPLRDVRNESSGTLSHVADTRLVCELRAGADAELCRARLLETWPVSIEIPVQLHAPLASIVRAFVDDPATQNDALTALLSTIR